MINVERPAITISQNSRLATFTEEISMRRVFLPITILMILALMMVACGGSDDSSEPADTSDDTTEESTMSEGDPVAGETAFQSTCAACHGQDGKGLPNLGKNMTTSEFIAGSTDAELLAFVKVGRPIGDPANTTGVDMPPKGGNPALTDEDILNIISYIRTLPK
jgi:disulfide bond formation protein DsbB